MTASTLQDQTIDGRYGVRIGLSAVVMTLRDRQLCVLTTGPADAPALPFGPFDPVRDRTFELSLRAFVTAQTGFRPGFVEQLYTFGDAGRASPRPTPQPTPQTSAGLDHQREISVGYLALTRDVASADGAEARWTPVFDIVPWEDRRAHADPAAAPLSDALTSWAGDDPRRRSRVAPLFAQGRGVRWNEERVLERYELLYEAGLAPEARRDGLVSAPVPSYPIPGLAMASDHRRILATGLGRLRSKLKYRPVLFELTPQTFTLSELQSAAEAVAGLSLHKQNFRRGVERTGLVEATGQLSAQTGGRPAELFRFVGADPHGGSRGGSRSGQVPGLALPALR